MKRPAWVARRIAERKALRALSKCELCGIKKAMGYIADPSNKTRGVFQLKLACPSCAQDAKMRTDALMAQKERSE